MEAKSHLLYKQGAEAKLYTSSFYGKPCIVKQRFKKSYRHPTLDRLLTSQRIKSEIRAMLRCRMVGIVTPTVYFLDMENSSIYMEYIENSDTFRDFITQTRKRNPSMANSILEPLACKFGQLLGKMHSANIIHGDLTTSNILIKGDPNDLNLVLIDFGLSSFESLPEDKGVDLYVLERAFLSSHPDTEELFAKILTGYREENKKGCMEIMKKLDEVRMRGRKRTMVG